MELQKEELEKRELQVAHKEEILKVKEQVFEKRKTAFEGRAQHTRKFSISFWVRRTRAPTPEFYKCMS